MSKPKVPYTKTDPARVSYVERDDLYKRAIGYWPNHDKNKPKLFFLGRNEAVARERALKLTQLWEGNRQKWTVKLLQVAESIAKGKPQHVVQLTEPERMVTPSAFEGVDGIDLREAAWLKQQQHEAKELAQKVKTVIPVVLEDGTGKTEALTVTLHQTLDAYVEHCRQTYRVAKAQLDAESEMTPYGMNEIHSALRLKQCHPDVTLDQFDQTSIKRIVDYWTSRPIAKTHQSKKVGGKRIGLSTVQNHIKVLRRFVGWLGGQLQWAWKKPEGLAEVWRVNYRKLAFEEEKAAKAVGPQTWTIEELKVLYKCANDRERTLMLLGLNCGFSRAEARTCRLAEMSQGKSGKHYIKRIRLKTDVYGEYWLWPEAVQAIAWFRSQRRPSILDGSPYLLVTEKGKQYSPQKISNAWRTLLNRVGREHPEFRRLPYKHLRKTAAQLMRKVGASAVTVRVFHSRGTPVPSDEQADRYYRRAFRRVFKKLAAVRRLLAGMFAEAPAAFTKPQRKGGGLDSAVVKQIRQMAGEGYTKAEISRRLQVSVPTVYKYLPEPEE